MMDISQYPEPDLSTRRTRNRNQGEQAVIAYARRTPIGKLGGALQKLSAPRLASHIIADACQGLPGLANLADECILGQVLPAGVGQHPARQASLWGGIPETVPAMSLNKVCGSGLKSVMLAAQAIESGAADCVISGGMESMSQAPYLVPGARSGLRLGHKTLVDSMVHDGLWDVYGDMHMGVTGELVAAKYDISREEQDAYALESHQKAIAAHKNGAFQDEIVHLSVKERKAEKTVEQDESPREDTSLERLSSLRPAFQKDGSVTAGNAPGCNDGAAVAVVTTQSYAQEQGWTVLAKIVDYVSIGLHPAWVMLSPIPAIRTLLAQARWEQDSVDLWEVNEAFSVQALAVMRELNLDKDKVNVHGGAVALGHPIGASGCRVLVTLLHALRRHNKKRGVAALCLGGGNGVAMAIERL